MFKRKLLKKAARLVVLKKIKTYSDTVDYSSDYSYYDEYDELYDLNGMDLSNVLEYAYKHVDSHADPLCSFTR